MDEQNLLRHMAIAAWDASIEGWTLERAYRTWPLLSEEGREELRARVRPLLPFVARERTRADAAEAEVARLTAELERTQAVARGLARAAYAYQAYENAIIDARGTTHAPTRDLSFRVAGEMFATFRVALSCTLVQFEALPEEPPCQSHESPSDTAE